MDASKKWMIFQFTPHQTTTLPKLLFFQKLWFNSFLLLNSMAIVRHSRRFPKQQRLAFFSVQIMFLWYTVPESSCCGLYCSQQLSFTFRMPSLSASGSHSSPEPSSSMSCWSAFGASGQLSMVSGMPSRSRSSFVSQTSPNVSSSTSDWSGLRTRCRSCHRATTLVSWIGADDNATFTASRSDWWWSCGFKRWTAGTS